jgi:hypothetical protein
MRDDPILNRRRLLTAFAAAPLAAITLPARAQSDDAAQVRFRAVGADTYAIDRRGSRTVAVILQRNLLEQMHKVFEDLIAPNDVRAPTLVARISSVTMASFAGGEGDIIGPLDYIEGDGIVVDGGRQLSSTHLLTSLSPSYSGSWYTQGIDDIRIESLAYQFAYWLRREMNL